MKTTIDLVFSSNVSVNLDESPFEIHTEYRHETPRRYAHNVIMSQPFDLTEEYPDPEILAMIEHLADFVMTAEIYYPNDITIEVFAVNDEPITFSIERITANDYEITNIRYEN